jgi:hypothetical protein
VRFLYIALLPALLAATAATAADEACLEASNGAACPDDDDPCTIDQCAEQTCRHVDVPNRITCEPLLDAYRWTLGLQDLVDELSAALATTSLPSTARLLVDDAIAGAALDLVRTSEVLAGRIAVPPPIAGETIAQARARSAFGIVRATPPRVRAVIRILAVPAVRAAAGPVTVDLARRVRFLYRSTNRLKRELRRLQRVSGVFTR